MRILLTGSSGFVGSYLQQALTDLHHEVIPCSRATGFDFNTLVTADAWRPHLKNIDVVINCVGIIAESRTQRFEQLHKLAPIALFTACEQCGVSKVIQISALGNDDSAFTPYQLSRKAADDVLRESELDWTILQPSLIYGAGGGSFRLFRFLAKFPLITVPGKGDYLVQPVHIHDVVGTVLASLNSEKATKKTIGVVGAKALSYRDWLQAIRHSLGKPSAYIVSMPFRLLFILSKAITPIFPLFSEANLRMLKSGSSASAKDITDLLERPPISVEEGLQR